MKKALKIISVIALVGIIACVFFACVPSNLEKAQAKMEEAGYTVLSSTWRLDNLDGAFNATKVSVSEGSGTMSALYFKDKDSAKKAYDELAGENKENIKQNGRWVYFGTKAAIEAFEK